MSDVTIEGAIVGPSVGSWGAEDMGDVGVSGESTTKVGSDVSNATKEGEGDEKATGSSLCCKLRL